MNFLTDITKLTINDCLSGYYVIICKIRNSRLKAKQIAILELVCAQYNNKILVLQNGPLGDIKGIFSVLCPKDNLISFKERLFGIGYCFKFYLLDFDSAYCDNHTDLNSINPLIWKGKKFSISDFYCQDNTIYEEQSPHKREFRIIDANGEEKTIYGYRGDGSELGRRSLPVEDARCMVNLSIPSKNKRCLDPFAGAGGIVHAFKYINPDGVITSMDIDPILKPGLELYGSTHYVMNAANASFPENSFDSLITEVPFSLNAINDICKTVSLINVSISNNGVFVIMCGEKQYSSIYSAMTELENYYVFNHKIDRKGVKVEISVWRKTKSPENDIENFITALKKIY